MSDIDKQALREAAEKATKGEWWSDVVETDGEYGEGEDRVSGYHSYAVYVGHESLLDMTNSTAACIHTEWDHDYQMAWDETAKRNAEFIVAANPTTVLALLDELESADKYAKDRDAENKDLMLTVGRLRVEKEAAEKRIAELEARVVVVPDVSNDEFWLNFNARFVFREETYRTAVFKALDDVGINNTSASSPKGE